MSAIDRERFPKGMLIAAGALVLFAIGAASLGRMTNVAQAETESRIAAQGAPTKVVEVRFYDEADGSVTVREATSDQIVEVIRPGADGFIRGVMRGLAHARRVRDIDATPPFRLSQWDNGEVLLEDPATGRIINLRAFGKTNSAAFARLIALEESAS